MQLIHTKSELQEQISKLKKQGKSIGFVPTMGALHQGHLSLMQRAKSENQMVVCSIFVNPIQFNNPTDLEKYPRDLDTDINFIKDWVDIVFAPSVLELYPEPPTEKFNFGTLETVMEGKFRPGHFQGVAIVVSRLFYLIEPDTAYFGEKDFQQLAIIKQIVKDLDLAVKIIPCPIIREPNGLAMSSRNRRLSKDGFEKSALIYKTLKDSTLLKGKKIEDIQQAVIQDIEKDCIFEVEYFELVDGDTLQPVSDWKTSDYIVGCIAVYLENIRLIDNIRY
jgi:pantoate--beta-alanine ligase